VTRIAAQWNFEQDLWSVIVHEGCLDGTEFPRILRPTGNYQHGRRRNVTGEWPASRLPEAMGHPLQRQAHQAEVRRSLRWRVGSPARGRVERRRTLIAVTLSHDQALLVVGTNGICYNAMGCRYSGAGGIALILGGGGDDNKFVQ
jgi:hypothetical protein